MIKVNDWKDLQDVLASLDSEEYIKIKIGNTTIDLFYDKENDKFSLFEDCHVEFRDLDEMDTYIQWWYLVN